MEREVEKGRGPESKKKTNLEAPNQIDCDTLKTLVVKINNYII